MRAEQFSQQPGVGVILHNAAITLGAYHSLSKKIQRNEIKGLCFAHSHSPPLLLLSKALSYLGLLECWFLNYRYKLQHNHTAVMVNSSADLGDFYSSRAQSDGRAVSVSYSSAAHLQGFAERHCALSAQRFCSDAFNHFVSRLLCGRVWK